MSLLQDSPATVLLLLGALVITGIILWRWRHAALRHRALDAEGRSQLMQQRMDLIVDQANDIVLIFDEQMRIIEANDRAVTAYGWTMPELLQRTATDLRAPAAQANAKDDFARTLSSDGGVFETLHRRKDGTSFPVEVSSRSFEIAGRRHVVSLVRDITERRVQQEEIERLSRMYLVISRVNEQIIRARSQPELFEGICRILVKDGGFRMAWIGWLNPATKRIEPVAVEGDDHAYVPQIHISADPIVPEGRGPSGTAFREGRTYVCNDFANDPATVPWQERAARSGFKSTIALPLRCEGRVAGLLTVYAVEKDYFRPGKVELLEKSAANVSFVLDVLAGEARRRAAETAVQASERQLQFLVTATPAILYSLRADGSYAISFLSPNIREVLGYEQETALSVDFWRERVHPDDMTAANAAVARLADPAGPAIVTREYRFRHADGSWRWMHDETRLVRDAAGRPVEPVGYWIDITESKRVQNALRESEELHRLVVENSTDAIWLYDVVESRFVYFSPAIERIMGYTREEMMQRSITDVLAPGSTEDAQRLINQRFAALAAGGGSPAPYLGRFDHIHKDGSVRICEVSATLLLDAAGRPHRILGVTRDLTERMRAETALARSQELYRLIAENTQDIIWLYDLGTERFNYVSPSADSLLGYTREDIQQADLTSILTPASAALARATLQRRLVALAAGDLNEIQHIGTYDHLRKDGGIRTCEVISTVLFDPDGKPTQILGVARDITERVRSEMQLHKLSRVVEQSPASIVITDLTGRIEYVNPWFCTLTGYTFDEVCGQNSRVLKSGATPAAVYTEMWTTLAAGRTWRGELVNRKKNGELHTERAVITPVFDPDGQATHYVAIKDDITERRHLETVAQEALQRFNQKLEQQVAERTAELATQKQQIQALLNAIPDTVMRLRTDGAVLFSQPAQTSPRLAAITPTPAATPSYQATAMLLASSTGLGRRALAERATVIDETRVETPGGNLDLELRTAPTGLDEFVVFTRDITARKQLEAETAALLEREHQISEMKTRFISVTSHEFRTPMAAILSSVELLANHLDRLAPEKRAQIFERMMTSLQRMTAMLDEVLTLNRMDAHRTEVRLAAIELAPFLQGVIQEVQTGDRHAHPFELRPPGADTRFVTDPKLFQHIVSNLAGNAVRYSPAGAPVTIRAELDAWRLQLTVEDRGIGVPAADRARIFDPFERGSNVGNIKGTGLGLNIVKRMTELLGGSILLEDGAEGGSRFVLTFPLLQLPSPPPS